MSSIIIMTICHLYNQKQSNVGFLFESRYMSSHELQISSKLFMCNSITHCFWSVVYCKVGFGHRRVFFFNFLLFFPNPFSLKTTQGQPGTWGSQGFALAKGLQGSTIGSLEQLKSKPNRNESKSTFCICTPPPSHNSVGGHKNSD